MTYALNVKFIRALLFRVPYECSILSTLNNTHIQLSAEQILLLAPFCYWISSTGFAHLANKKVHT